MLQITAVEYLITEFELLGLYVNKNQFKHFVAKVDFDCAVDHFGIDL